jgi:glucokinase
MNLPKNEVSRGNARLMKAINVGTVLKLVRDRGPLSRSQIARLSGLATPTVATILESLTAEGVITPVGLGDSTGGRKPLLFQFNPDAALIVGVDVGGTKMAGGLSNLAGHILARETVTREDGPADTYERLVSLIERLIVGVPHGAAIRGIGLGVAGVTKLADGIVTLAPGLGWSNFPLGPILEERFGIPVFLDNDVNTILLGERWFGAARESEDVLCVAVGTGIGAAILMGGQIYRGAEEAAGEVGYFVTDAQAFERRPRAKGDYGFLEEEAAGPGIARRGSERFGRPVTTAEVMRLAAEENPTAKAVLDETVRHIGIALANMATLLNPELVILTGGVMRSADLLIEPIREMVHRLTPYPPKIVVSQLLEEAGVLGAAALVLEATRRSIRLDA